MEGGEKPERFSVSPEAGDFSNDLEIQTDNRSKKEKAITISAITVAAVAVLVIFFVFSRGITNPGWLDFNEFGGSEACEGGDCPIAGNLADNQVNLTKDTDGDGITDFEELNVYKTSPFLEDSDSDGLSDSQEIAAGRDPNCPGSESCSAVAGSPVAGGVVPTLGASPEADQVLHNQIISGQATPEVIRALLLQGGMSAEDLVQISDEDLLDFYKEFLAASGQPDGENGGSLSGLDVSNLNIGSIEDLQSFSGAQIRALLIQEGAPADVLDQISDDDLRSMFLGHLAEQVDSY